MKEYRQQAHAGSHEKRRPVALCRSAPLRIGVGQRGPCFPRAVIKQGARRRDNGHPGHTPFTERIEIIVVGVNGARLHCRADDNGQTPSQNAPARLPIAAPPQKYEPPPTNNGRRSSTKWPALKADSKRFCADSNSWLKAMPNATNPAKIAQSRQPKSPLEKKHQTKNNQRRAGGENPAARKGKPDASQHGNGAVAQEYFQVGVQPAHQCIGQRQRDGHAQKPRQMIRVDVGSATAPYILIHSARCPKCARRLRGKLKYRVTMTIPFPAQSNRRRQSWPIRGVENC